jgi:hypothetical protein
VSTKPGYLESPYAPFVLVDVHGLETGTLVIDPLSKKGFVVPEMPAPAPLYAPPPGGKTIIDRGLRKKSMSLADYRSTASRCCERSQIPQENTARLISEKKESLPWLNIVGLRVLP